VGIHLVKLVHAIVSQQFIHRLAALAAKGKVALDVLNRRGTRISAVGTGYGFAHGWCCKSVPFEGCII
jgi:hypothetical protein